VLGDEVTRVLAHRPDGHIPLTTTVVAILAALAAVVGQVALRRWRARS
jgi:hypothetical protein